MYRVLGWFQRQARYYVADVVYTRTWKRSGAGWQLVTPARKAGVYYRQTADGAVEIYVSRHMCLTDTDGNCTEYTCRTRSPSGLMLIIQCGVDWHCGVTVAVQHHLPDVRLLYSSVSIRVPAAAIVVLVHLRFGSLSSAFTPMHMHGCLVPSCSR